MDSEHIRFENTRGMDLAALVDHPDGVAHDDDGEQLPGVVLCHAFTGFKEIPHLEALAEEATDRGMVAFRFDFSDCVGESEGRCEDMKLSSQIQDLDDALRFFEAMGEVDEQRIGVAGHSLGGMTALLVASKDDAIKAVAPIAAPANHEGEQLFQGKEIERWREMGHTHFPTVKRGEVKIGWAFYEDLQQYDGMEAAKDIEHPVKFVHGDSDEIVPLSNSEQMYEQAPDPKALHVVEGADHLFRKEEHEREMVEEVVEWLENHLSS